MSTPVFTLRPLEGASSTPSNALEGSFRIHLSQSSLKQLGATNGDRVRLKTSNGFKGFGVAWLSSQTNPGNKSIAKISHLLLEKYQLTLSDSVSIEKVTGSAKPLKSIEISVPESHTFVSPEHLLFWIRNALVSLEIILPGCTVSIQRQEPRNPSKIFRLRSTVTSVEPPPNEHHPAYFDPVLTHVTLTGERYVEKPVTSKPLQLDSAGIGGLSDQTSTINESLYHLQLPVTRHKQFRIGTTSFLLHGPEGTGKSLLLDRLAECPWQAVYRIDSASVPKGQAKTISDTFEDARDNQPSLILMDDLDKFLEKAEPSVTRLRVELKKLEGSRVVVAAAARSIHDIDASLRTPTTFKTEIEIFPPNTKQREDILRHSLKSSNKFSKLDYLALAERSHGFVGRDLDKLCRLAGNQRVRRACETLDDEKVALYDEALENGFIEQEDFDAVFEQVRPTVLKDSILEVPKIMWTEIAGLDHVRAELEAITVRPFKNPERYAKLGAARQRKGVLLYGPPGCAKTLIAQAVATESNQNFLAVKGSELVKMYVGESERAIRDVFRKARAAKPCIIFFDEIDSIGKSREKTHDSGLNVVTTLLNEMDGIEALQDVFIIGATNRPDILDSALIRPGRFDSHIHIGLPNEEARKQILEIHTRNMALAADIDLGVIASSTDGSSGADLSGLCAVAVENACVDLEKFPEIEPQVRMCHFEKALESHVPHTLKEEAVRYEGWRVGLSLSAN